MDILKVLKLGFGTSQIGGPSLINGELIGARPISKREAIDILEYAYDNGINFFDTSDKYGNAEELLGEVFLKVRDKVVIATKCGLTDAGGRFFAISYVNACIENSLRRLKTNYIDIFQLAKPNVEEVSDELLFSMEKNIKEGKIRNFGISVTGNDDGCACLSKEVIGSLQIFYNLLFTDNHTLIGKCAQKGKFVIVRSPLNSGVLSGAYTMNTEFDKIDSRSKVFHGDLLKERIECVEKIKSHFNLEANEVLTLALNFLFSNPEINVVIPAVSKLEQLKNYLTIFNRVRRLDKAELKEILDFSQTQLCCKGRSQFK